jgi:hypothetical protein
MGGLKYDAVEQATVQIIAHERPIQKIPRKTGFNLADLIQLREMLRVQRPFDAVQIVLQLRQLPCADDRNGVAPRPQPVERDLRGRFAGGLLMQWACLMKSDRE